MQSIYLLKQKDQRTLKQEVMTVSYNVVIVPPPPQKKKEKKYFSLVLILEKYLGIHAQIENI